MILGDDSNVEFKGNQVYVNGNRLDHLKKEDVQVAKGYIDVKSELNTLKGNADYLRGLNQSDGVIINSADMNNRSIDVSRAKDNQIVVNVDKDWLEAPQPITIKGLNSNANGPVVILNVQGIKNEVNWQTQIHLVYDDGSSLSPNEGHSKSNHVLWNFGNDVKKLNINGGYLMRSVLAPNSELTVNVNADGNLIADRVNIRGGESHRWDLWAPELVKHSKPAKPADTKPGKPDNKSDQHKPNHDDSKKGQHTPDSNKPTSSDKNKTPKPTTPGSTDDKTPTNPSTPDENPIIYGPVTPQADQSDGKSGKEAPITPSQDGDKDKPKDATNKPRDHDNKAPKNPVKPGNKPETNDSHKNVKPNNNGDKDKPKTSVVPDNSKDKVPTPPSKNPS